jgi:hypothetical protein
METIIFLLEVLIAICWLGFGYNYIVTNPKISNTVGKYIRLIALLFWPIFALQDIWGRKEWKE